MADSIDPADLKSVAQLAQAFGYSPKYFANLAAANKFKAWRIGNTWATTKKIIQEYVRAAPPPGPRAITKRPQKQHRKNKKST